MENLCWPCHKIGQGHPKVMIYINFVELFSLMLHAKAFWFWRRRFLKFLFAIYSHGGNLGHVTLIMHINFHSPFLRILNKMFGFGETVSEKKIFEKYGNIYMYIAPGWGQTCPWGPFFRIINIQSICPFP